MFNSTEIDAQFFLEKWTLIVGDVNAGKTSLTRDILNRVYRKVAAHQLAIIDMAPVIPEETVSRLGLSGVGGRLIDPNAIKGLYLSASIDPPRLSTSTEEEALLVAERNCQKIEKLLQTFSESRRNVLFVNDISLYLQAGNTADLIRHFSGAATLVANGYMGTTLGRGALSQREHREMQALMEAFTEVIRL
jgi:hypothetical protein